MQTSKIIFLAFVLVLTNTYISAQKTVHIPQYIKDTGMDLKNNNSQWSYARSEESENVVVFWEKGFGLEPSLSPVPYTIDISKLLEVAEKSYKVMLDSLKFAIKDSSVTDKYKFMIFLLYTEDWAASGAGADDLVGAIWVSPSAANLEHVVAHEIGHGFQYITGCDTDGGFRYGFNEVQEGGNGFWEQCAQWMAYKVYPEQNFVDGGHKDYIKSNHLHIIHENTRYDNYFITEYWAYKHGIDFIGRLWRHARRPEDPIEAYKRITNIDQQAFNNEIYEHASRLTTWDIPSLKDYGKDYIHKRGQVKMNLSVDSFWHIDRTVCLENYGYNSIKLEVPAPGVAVKVNFKGLAGDPRYRIKNIDQAGWNFGFVALLSNGQRVYGGSKSVKYSNGSNPESTLSFITPENCTHLWLVVSGAPQQHWRHGWDDNSSNDEHWPYKVKFENTNLVGSVLKPLKDLELAYVVKMEPRSNYTPAIVKLNSALITDAFNLAEGDINQKLGREIKYYAINPNGDLDSISTAYSPGHWYDKTGKVTKWNNNSFVSSELDLDELHAKIGQFPNALKLGDSITIRQALIYRRIDGAKAKLTLTFKVYITKDITSSTNAVNKPKLNIYPNPTSDFVSWGVNKFFRLYDLQGRLLIHGKGSQLDLTPYQNGMYLINIDKETYKVIKK